MTWRRVRAPAPVPLGVLKIVLQVKWAQRCSVIGGLPASAPVLRAQRPAGGEHANGYTFTGMDEGSLNSALDRALTAFRCPPVRCCMGGRELWRLNSGLNIIRARNMYSCEGCLKEQKVLTSGGGVQSVGKSHGSSRCMSDCDICIIRKL